MSTPCDLRSDTVTRPTPAMRAAMAGAVVGDDALGEDPSVKALEEYVADLLGKEAALFVPSGTMSNQLAIKLHTSPGDEVIVGEGAHVAWYEGGAAPVVSGVQFSVAGRGGLFTAEDLEAALKPRSYYTPAASLVVLENTHNRAGGRVFPPADVAGIGAKARELGVGLHLDGARIWNAAAASGSHPKALAAPFDSLSVCFSKGLGAPVGSALVGSAALVRRALRYRRMLGGAMRQSGILAAGALYALEHHRERLAEDHAAARRFAEIVAESRAVAIDPARVETNIVNVVLNSLEADQVVPEAAESGVLLSAMGPRLLRAVTHLDVTTEAVVSAAKTLVSVLARLA